MANYLKSHLPNISNSEKSNVEEEAQDNSLILTPLRRRYTLEELIAQCDPNAPIVSEEEIWGKGAPVGNEIG